MNKFKKIQTEIQDIYIIEPTAFEDNRGFFMESWNKRNFQEIGINIDFVQDNHSYTKDKGTIRGIHFQLNPKSQTKLVRCTRGEILDLAVDLRKNSPTYKQYISVKLTQENKRMLLIPKGFGHAFLTLTDNVEVQYKTDEYYSPKHDRNIIYNDPELNIQWPFKEHNIIEPILSSKDRNAPCLKDSDVNFE